MIDVGVGLKVGVSDFVLVPHGNRSCLQRCAPPRCTLRGFRSRLAQGCAGTKTPHNHNPLEQAHYLEQSMLRYFGEASYSLVLSQFVIGFPARSLMNTRQCDARSFYKGRILII